MPVNDKKQKNQPVMLVASAQTPLPNFEPALYEGRYTKVNIGAALLAYEEEAEKFQAGYGDFKFFNKISGPLEEYLLTQFKAAARAAPTEWPNFFGADGTLKDVKKVLSGLTTRKNGELWKSLKKLCPTSGDSFAANPYATRDAEIMKLINKWQVNAPQGHGEFLLAQDIAQVMRKYSTGNPLKDSLATIGHDDSQPFCKAMYKRLETRTSQGGAQSIFPRNVKMRWEADTTTRVTLASDSDGKTWEFCRLGDFCAFFVNAYESMYRESMRHKDLGFDVNDHGKRSGDSIKDSSSNLNSISSGLFPKTSKGHKKPKKMTKAQEKQYLMTLLEAQQQDAELQSLRAQVYGPKPSVNSDSVPSGTAEIIDKGLSSRPNSTVTPYETDKTLTALKKASVQCYGCGRFNHTRTKCPFGPACHNGAHKDFNTQGTWSESESYRKLQACKDGQGRPYNVLQCRLSANALTGKLDPILTGPQTFVKPTQVERPSHKFPNEIVDCDLTACYSMLSRLATDWSGPELTGTINGEAISLLLDTGSSDYNFISSAIIDLWGLRRHHLRQPVRVRSIHSTTTCHMYCIISLTITHINSSYSLTIPCIELNSSPRDVVIGLPTIQEHKLADKFEAYYAQIDPKQRAKHRALFPEFTLTLSDFVEHSRPTGKRPFNEVGQPNSQHNFTNSYPDKLPIAVGQDLSTSTFSKLPKRGIEPCNDAAPPAATSLYTYDSIGAEYEVVLKDKLLDHDVTPDVDGLIEDDDLDDPQGPPNSDGPGYKVFGSTYLQARLRRLLKDYDDIFATTLPAEPAKLTPISFKVDGEKWRADKRTMQYPRPQPQAKEEGIEAFIEMALKNGLIRPAPSVPNWSQVVLVLKPNGKDWRFCVDYTVLNQFMESVGWPIPHIGSILRRIVKHRPTVFATMDGTQGFYQMEVEMSSQEFLCFTTYMGNYVFQRAPMGPKTVPALFQRAMSMEVFPDLVHKIMEIYIDDFIVWGRSDDEFLTNLKQVFHRLRATNVKINPNKCKFGLAEVEYVGHKITAEGLTFAADKISEVSEFERPQSQGGLKSFLGMAGYFREHVDHYVDLIYPLGQLVSHYRKKSRHFTIDWTPELIEQFEKVKAAIGNVSTLYHRDETAPLRLYTDASSYGIGAYLCQIVTKPDGKQQEQPLAFISKTLSDQEKRWSVYEKEAYAIYYSIKKFDHFLRGNHFTLFTDHRNLTFLNKPPSDKVMRWRLAVQEFGFNVAYIKGELNNIADSMSRCVAGQSTAQANDISYQTSTRKTTHSHMVEEGDLSLISDTNDDSITDSNLYSIYRDNRRHYFPTTENMDSFLNLLDGVPCSLEQIPVQTCLFTNITDQQHPLVTHQTGTLPEPVLKLLQQCHNAQVGHGGVDRTLQLLQQLSSKSDAEAEPIIRNWTTIRADTKKFVKQCPICQKVKDYQLAQFTPKFTTSTYGLFDNISMDSIYMPESTRGNKYILTIIDSFSRYIDVYPIADLTAATAFECLLKFMSNFGIPSHVCTDNGTQFKGILEDVLTLAHVNQYRIQPYSHQENSIVERANKEILSALRALVLEHRLKNDWDILCHVAKRIINSRIHSSIGISPVDLVFGGQIDLQRGSIFPYKLPEQFKGDKYMKTLVKHQEQMLLTAMQYQNKINAERLKNQNPALKTIFPDHSYVLAKPEVGPADKLTPPWLGPYQITSRLERPEGDVYTVVHVATNQQFDFRVDRLKQFDFDPNLTRTYDTAAMDFQGDIVESVLGHKFTGAHTASNLQLRLKWLGAPEVDWYPFSDSLADVGIVHEYFRRHPQKLSKFIPSKYQNT
jgi:hypothetical protein